jgi:hypothetical protein
MRPPKSSSSPSLIDLTERRQIIMSSERGNEPTEAHTDPLAKVLEPNPDVLLHLEVPDELVKYYLLMARAAGMVYAQAVKQLINRIYRDHDYVRRRQLEGKHTNYDRAVERDSPPPAWLISVAALYVPEEVKRHPIPPRPPRPTKRQPKTDRAKRAKQQRQSASSSLGATSTKAEMLAKAEALLDAAHALQVRRQEQ